ncbi:MAG TPA: chloride channel protein [Acidimicrobiia bacterium]|jgi:CIC family chloride channel protein|nr:chloride channel protein [Acidimicrobiia bacterium]
MSDVGSRIRRLVARSREQVVVAALVGVVTGLAVAGFERLTVNVVFDRGVAHFPLWLLAVTPGLGLAVATLWLRRVGHGVTPATADEYIGSFHDGRPLRLADLVHRVVGAVATLGSGGAMGLEGPSIYIGATFGSLVQQRFGTRLRSMDRNVLLVAGAAAGIAAIFKAPATGAIFAIEVPYQEDLARRTLLPALVGGATGYLGLVAINGTVPLFPIHGAPPFSFVDLTGAAALGLAAALCARAFAWLLHRAKDFAAGANPVVGVVGAGASIAVLFAIGRGLTGQSLVLTPGYSVVTWALDPKHGIALLLAVLVLRCLATGATVAGGGVGGLFVPLVVAGALLGRAFAGALGQADTSLFLVVGIAAFLGAGYRVPLAAVMFVAEATGRPGFVVPGLIAAVVAELVMGDVSVTTYQVRPKAT